MIKAKPVSVLDSELAAAIVNVAVIGEPLRVEIDGEVYTLLVQCPYDPEKVREALDKYVGAWAHLDGDALLEQLYRAREEGSRPADGPECRRGGTGDSLEEQG